MPDRTAGTADVVMFVRALHNLARFNEEHGYLDAALADAFEALKSGGTFGVVQHWARDDMPDEWADGSNGYLKREFVIARAEAVGFEFVAESDVNSNPNDQPSTEDEVWRLPPSLRVPEDAEDSEALRVEYEAIGESHRMTLKFRKP
jgi:predicted methyltransferase